MARVDTVAWLKSQVATLRKTHNDAATSLKNLITGQTVSLSPGVWAPAAQGIQTPPAGAGGWFQISGANGWTALSAGAKPAVRLLPANMVFFVGTMSAGTLTTPTTILATLPSWAWPQNAGCRVALCCDGGSAGSGYLTMSLSGVVQCRDVPSGTTTIGWACVYPLDSPVAP